MITRKLQINCLKTLVMLLIAGLFVSGTVQAEIPGAAVSLKYEIIECVDTKDMAAAETKIDQLWLNYKSTEGFVELVSPLMGTYWHAGEYTAHQELAERIVTNFPNDPLAPLMLQHQIGGYIHLKDIDTARTKLDQLWTNYKSTEGFVELVNPLLGNYWWAGEYVAHQELAERIITNFPDDPLIPVLLRNQIKVYIAPLKDMDAASAKLDRLWTNYKSTEGFVELISPLLGKYWWAGEYVAHQELAERIITNFPANEQLSAHAAIGMDAVRLGDDVTAQAKLDLILTDYKDHPKAGYSVFAIGEEYYNKAEKAISESDKELAKSRFQKAVSIWDKNITEINDSQYKCFAYYFSAISYQYLDDIQRSTANYQKVFSEFPDSEYAAHSLFMTGRNLEKLRRSVVASEQATEITDPNSVPTSVAATTTQINSTRAAYELLLEKYPNSPGALHASRWLNKRNSN